MAETTLAALAAQIAQLHAQTSRTAAAQINYWLTVRNWLIGWHIAEYEQGGSDRAAYGEQLLPELARRLQHVKGMAVRRLYDCREFYQVYPHILQTVYAELQRAGVLAESPPLTASKTAVAARQSELPGIASELLLSRLSFSHFLELLPLDNAFKGRFTRCRR